MNQNKLTFVSENLIVDYISFKFQYLEDWKEKELASYLLKLGFNCSKKSGKLSKPIKTPIFMELKNIHEACFVVDNPYWQGTIVTFSGLSAKFFYLLLKEKKFSEKDKRKKFFLLLQFPNYAQNLDYERGA